MKHKFVFILLATASVLLALSNPLMADVNREQTPIETLNTGHKAKAATQIQPIYNTDKSKIEALLGETRVSYSLGGNTYTDSIEINDLKLRPDFGYIGINQPSTFCGYRAYSHPNLPKYDYACLHKDPANPMRLKIYTFNIENNVIKQGAYILTNALSSDISNFSFELKPSDPITPMTGYKVSNQARSSYSNIQWNSKGAGADYCIDIVDEHMNIYPGFQAIRCGKDMTSFSPIEYVQNTLHINLPNGFTFYWRVWSLYKGRDSYGGDGYEGKVVVQ